MQPKSERRCLGGKTTCFRCRMYGSKLGASVFLVRIWKFAAVSRNASFSPHGPIAETCHSLGSGSNLFETTLLFLVERDPFACRRHPDHWQLAYASNLVWRATRTSCLGLLPKLTDDTQLFFSECGSVTQAMALHSQIKPRRSVGQRFTGPKGDTRSPRVLCRV